MTRGGTDRIIHKYTKTSFSQLMIIRKVCSCIQNYLLPLLAVSELSIRCRNFPTFMYNRENNGSSDRSAAVCCGR